MKRLIACFLSIALFMCIADRYSATAISMEQKHVVLVVVIDTGVDLDNEQLRNTFWENSAEKPYNGKDDDGNGYVDDHIGFNAVDNRGSGWELSDPHGTTVSAIVAGLDYGSEQDVPSDIQKFIRIVPVKALPGESWALVRAIAYAVSLQKRTGLKMVINLSMVLAHDAYTPEVYDILDVARNQGILVVAAVGNDNGKSPRYPAAYNLDNIISVASVEGAVLADYSNISGDIGADGLVLWKGASWGTSFATPHVSRIAAALFASNAHWNYRDVKTQILSSADRVPGLDAKVKHRRRLNDQRALALR